MITWYILQLLILSLDYQTQQVKCSKTIWQRIYAIFHQVRPPRAILNFSRDFCTKQHQSTLSRSLGILIELVKCEIQSCISMRIANQGFLFYEYVLYASRGTLLIFQLRHAKQVVHSLTHSDKKTRLKSFQPHRQRNKRTSIRSAMYIHFSLQLF